MTQQKDFLDRMRIASPCHVGWENMKGDERTRFCAQCSLNVHNISAMTRDEVASLVAKTEGRICARLYRRADGTVLTRDCPVGLRALRRRVSKAAGAALTTLLSLCSVAVGQSKPQEGKTGATAAGLQLKREAARDGQSALAGALSGVTGAAVQGAELTLVKEQTGERLTARSTHEGKFSFPGLAAGKYTLEIKAEGFKSHTFTGLEVNANEVALLDIALEPEEVVVGLVIMGIVDDLLIKTETKDEIKMSNGTTTIRGDIIQRLPLP